MKWKRNLDFYMIESGRFKIISSGGLFTLHFETMEFYSRPVEEFDSLKNAKSACRFPKLVLGDWVLNEETLGLEAGHFRISKGDRFELRCEDTLIFTGSVAECKDFALGYYREVGELL